MKKTFILFFLLCCSILSNAQDYGKYSLPNIGNQRVLETYIGQHVKLLRYGLPSESNNETGRNEYVFTNFMGGRIDEVYTIKNIKIKKDIVIELVSKTGRKLKAEINKIGNQDPYKLSSCSCFFLVDQFDVDNKESFGKLITNNEGVESCVVEGLIMHPKKSSYPVLAYKIRSKYDNKRFICEATTIDQFCSVIGTHISHPNANFKYQILSVNLPYLNGHVVSKDVTYNLKNPYTGQCKVRKIDDFMSVFDEDLEGTYRTILSEIEFSPKLYSEGKISLADKIDEDYVFNYKDKILDITMIGIDKRFNIIFQNLSNKDIKILWNDSYYTDYNGQISRILHSGIRYSDKNEYQEPSVIKKGHKYPDIVLIANQIIYSKFIDEWIVNSMYPEEQIPLLDSVQLVIPIEINNKIIKYKFNLFFDYIHFHPERIIID